MKINERKIHSMLLENADKLLKNLSVSASEFKLISANDILRREVIEGYEKGVVIGKIDLILRYKKSQYVTEIKYNDETNGSPDFWSSLKVLGYCEYYKWQTGIVRKIKPAVIVPIHSVRLEQQIIAAKLGVTIFAFYEDGGVYKLKLLSDIPIWKQ